MNKTTISLISIIEGAPKGPAHNLAQHESFYDKQNTVLEGRVSSYRFPLRYLSNTIPQFGRGQCLFLRCRKIHMMITMDRTKR